jgi:hypothetical protein
MAAGDLIPVTDADGVTGWLHEPPAECPNGHPWAPGRRAYAQGWFGCWCAAAEAAAEPRPGHLEFTCRACGGVVLVPARSDPTKKTGWAAHHGQ